MVLLSQLVKSLRFDKDRYNNNEIMHLAREPLAVALARRQKFFVFCFSKTIPVFLIIWLKPFSPFIFYPRPKGPGQLITVIWNRFTI